ncbi:MAG: NADH-quinone oxidoreductase subunit NuoE [Alphaproteobacteria bacterium]|nr:NADH-quinone oxidoreductase subunit NuoE [Alphaproteobacteria bacterium]
MSVRRLAPDEVQPSHFSFSPTNKDRVAQWIAKYPAGRQASAVIAALWIGQEQEGWVSKAMIEHVAEILGMPYIRVLEVATFYTMFHLAPAGEYVVQVCTTTPCMLRGSDELVAACKKHIHANPHAVSADGKFSWMEVECLGACVNAPMLQIGSDFYEDLDGPKTEALIEALRRGETPKPGPQNGRHTSEPLGGATTLLDRAAIIRMPSADRDEGHVMDASANLKGEGASGHGAAEPKSPGTTR